MAEQNDDEYERRTRKRYESAMRKMQEDMQKRELARRLLDDRAYERLMNIKAKDGDLYDQVLGMLVSLVQSQRLTGRISEKEFIALMQRATERHEPTISFKHK